MIDLNAYNGLSQGISIQDREGFIRKSLEDINHKSIDNILQEFVIFKDAEDCFHKSSELFDDKTYLELTSSLNDAEDILVSYLRKNYSKLSIPSEPTIDIKTENEFFKERSLKQREEDLIEHLELADPLDNDYVYHLREAYFCLRQTDELRKSNHPLIRAYIAMVSELEKM